MTLAAILAVTVAIGCLAFLMFTKVSPEVVMMAGLTVLVVAGVIPIKDAVAGFSNEGLLTVGVMFIIAAGLRDTGAMELFSVKLFGRTNSVRKAQARIMAPIMALSGFLNNTPLVAAFIPAISDWSKKNGISPSKLMIPLSYAAILGGTITIIGTSTNLVVNGLLTSETGKGFGFFEIAWVGIPCAAAGFLYVLAFGKWLLPGRKSAIEAFSNPKEYTIEMIVEPASSLINTTIEAAGLRHLPGLFLIEIDRKGKIIAAPTPDEILLENDRLIFTGVTESIVDLQKIKGLTPSTDQIFKLDTPRQDRCLIEAVVSGRNPLIGKTIKEGEFRSVYNAVVIGVARDGERLKEKIGDIELKIADTLLLETHDSFINRYRNTRDFLLIRQIEDSSPRDHKKGWIAWSILLSMILLASFEVLNILTAALLAVGAMLITKCVNSNTARRSIELQVLIVIGASFGIGKALELTGAAQVIAESFLSIVGDNPIFVLAGVYFLTMVMTEMITNNAAAIIMFPIAFATANSLGLNFMPFAIAITMAASASFSTPIGYQTNLMVYGPGGYKFNDYFKIGIPLNLMMWIISIIIIPQVWSFY
ncbi:MAG: SLC13 family permease [Ignavibacteriales bacterium]|nr:SLC13 family permease [Ignavibacteriales bacterium]MBK7380213.1 SLC13 family permease [Ignavibacteriales bacterium]